MADTANDKEFILALLEGKHSVNRVFNFQIQLCTFASKLKSYDDKSAIRRSVSSF